MLRDLGKYYMQDRTLELSKYCWFSRYNWSNDFSGVRDDAAKVISPTIDGAYQSGCHTAQSGHCLPRKYSKTHEIYE